MIELVIFRIKIGSFFQKFVTEKSRGLGTGINP